MGEHLPEHLEHRGPLLGLAAGGVARVEILMAGLAGAVLEQEGLDEEEGRQKEGRSEEEPARGRHPGHAVALGEAQDLLVDVESQVEPGRDHGAEYAGEDPALAHVEPVGVDLDDGDGPVALEIHVEGVEQGEDELERRDLGVRQCEDVQQIEPHQDVGQAGPARADEHAALAADLVRQRPVDQEGDPVDPGAHAEDGAEVRLGHQVAEGGLADGKVVAPHVEQSVGQTQREPVEEAALAVIPGMLRLFGRKSEGRSSWTKSNYPIFQGAGARPAG